MNERIYIYDGTFEGLLTCVYHHYYTAPAAGICLVENFQPSFLYAHQTVETDEGKAARVYDAISSKISDYDLRCVYRAFLSCDPEKEMVILRYLVKGFKLGPRISALHGDPVVYDLQNILKKVSRETERMLQFVRFSVVDTEDNKELLYAEVEPDHDVIQLIAGHFTDRYRYQPFIIRDVKRDKALIAYDKQWYISSFTAEEVPAFARDEQQYRRLWRTYFDHIAIKERINPRCQRNFMPDRYWKHLTEVNDTKRIV